MKGGRHLTVIALLVASVFLCLVTACGVPSYLVPDVASVSRDSYLMNVLDFKASYSAESANPSADKVGLILLYYRGDSTNSAGSSVINTFNSKYRPSNYDGYPISVSSNTPLFKVTSGDVDYDVYGFDISYEPVSAPYYTYGIADNPAQYSFRMTYDDISRSVALDYENDTVVDKVLTLYEGFPALDTSYIHVFGAISVQSPNYSNIYWSKLQYIGPISAEL